MLAQYGCEDGALEFLEHCGTGFVLRDLTGLLQFPDLKALHRDSIFWNAAWISNKEKQRELIGVTQLRPAQPLEEAG